VAASLKDGQRAADLSGHDLHTVASAAKASVWRISIPRRTPRMQGRVNIFGILHLLIPGWQLNSNWIRSISYLLEGWGLRLRFFG
jgi:hypothetical protein